MAYFTILRLRVEKMYLRIRLLLKFLHLDTAKIKMSILIAMLGLLTVGYFKIGYSTPVIALGQLPEGDSALDSWIGQGDKENAGLIPSIGRSIVTLTIGRGPTSEGSTASNIDPNGGAIGTLSRAVGTMIIDTPVSTEQYFAFLSERANIGPTGTYAQDQQTFQGFDLLNPILSLWTWARNIVYIFYVVIFLVIGVMIILRQRIGGQIPITIINSIPNVLLSLLLVTFSYAISGFIIDIMHLAMGVVHAGLFGTTGPGASVGLGNTSFRNLDMTVFRIFGATKIADIEAALDLPEFETGNEVINSIGLLIEQIANLNVLVSVVLAIAGLGAMFKIFFTLLSHWVTLMTYPLIAPFQFLLGSLPGRNAMIIQWFNKMIASAGAFVGVYVIFSIMTIITRTEAIPSETWRWWPPLTGFSSNTETIRHLLSYALFLLAPTIPAAIEQALQIKPGQAGVAVQQATAGAAQRIGKFIGL